jgi:hypothetical protein
MRTPIRAIIAAALGALTIIPAGCNIVGPAFFFIHGPEKAKKLHGLDAEKTTVVFVDDRQSRVPRRVLRVTMAEEAEKTLLQKRVVKDMISAQSALQAAGSDKHGKPIPISEIGRAVQAEVVIYATVDRFTLSSDGQTFAPEAEVRVKVMSVHDEKRLWPEDPAGHALLVRAIPQARDMPANVSARYQAEDELARRVGLEIAWLFFDHDKPTGPRVPN